jgi:hypothetical protein
MTTHLAAPRPAPASRDTMRLDVAVLNEDGECFAQQLPQTDGQE